MSDVNAATCGARIGTLAQDPRFAPRASELNALSRDLAEPDADRWSGVDLFAAFPPEASIEMNHRTLVERVVGICAAVSVFLPVGWTWWEFRKASAAYEAMIAADGEPKGRTFLGLWATGFDGRLDGLSHLAPMATVSVSLILFAILCLVLHRVIASANMRREERAARSARFEMTRLLTEASLILYERRADHPQRIEGVIKSSMDKLRKTQEAARKAVAELSVTAVNVGAGVHELLGTVHTAREETEALLVQAQTSHEALGTAASEAGAFVSQAVASLDNVVRTGVQVTEAAVTRSTEAIDHSVQRAIEASEGAVAHSGAALDESVQRSVGVASESVCTATGQLSQQLGEALAHFEQELSRHVDGLTTESVAAISHSGTALMGVVDRIGGGAQASASAAASLAEQVTVMQEDTTVARDDLRNALGDVRSALEAIEMALTRHESTLQGHASELTGTRDAAERMLHELTISVGAVNGRGSHQSEDGS